MDNASMHEQNSSDPVQDDQTALDALGSVDPDEAPDIAEGIAASLQRELDQTGDTTPEAEQES